jgi:hypothetical protein
MQIKLASLRNGESPGRKDNLKNSNQSNSEYGHE